MGSEDRSHVRVRLYEELEVSMAEPSANIVVVVVFVVEARDAEG